MDNQSKAHILKAIQTVGDLISLINNSDILRNDKVCGILLGAMQHCVYKIYRHAEREHQALKAKSRGRQRVLELQQEQRRNLNKSIRIFGGVDSGHRRRRTG